MISESTSRGVGEWSETQRETEQGTVISRLPLEQPSLWGRTLRDSVEQILKLEHVSESPGRRMRTDSWAHPLSF